MPWTSMLIPSDIRKCRRGILLIELLVYISLVSLILVLAAVVFNQFLAQSASLRKNISDIDRALKAGERWRADLRAAKGPPELRGNLMAIPQTEGELVYALGTNVTRQHPNSKTLEILLTGVRSNQFIFEQRAQAGVWRWEIELDSPRKEARVRPLFTFMAVAGTN